MIDSTYPSVTEQPESEGPSVTSPASPTAPSDEVRPRADRGSERAAATRRALLAAARDVFAESGFSAAGIAEVVSRAGASVGSLYHHFGGKADLYLALFEDFQSRQEERAVLAVRQARADGESDPVRLFGAGARAYLTGCWAERDLSRLFLAGGGPAGFELVARRRFREWTTRNMRVLLGGEDDEPLSDALVLMLTAIAAEAGEAVAACLDEAEASAFSEEIVELTMRLGRQG